VGGCVLATGVDGSALTATLHPLSQLLLARTHTALHPSADDDYSTQAKWVKIAQGLLIELGAGAEGGAGLSAACAAEARRVGAELLPILVARLGHPYKVCREEIGRCLFLLVTVAAGDGAVGAAFANDVVQQVLATVPSTAEQVKAAVEAADAAKQAEAGSAGKAAAEKEGAEKKNSVETALYWILHCVLAGENARTAPAVVPLLLLPAAVASHPDIDLSGLARHASEVLAQGLRLLSPAQAPWLLQAMAAVRSGMSEAETPSWHARRAALSVMETLAANHLMLLTDPGAGELREAEAANARAVVSALSDSQREVQEAARAVLSGILATRGHTAHIPLVKEAKEGDAPPAPPALGAGGGPATLLEVLHARFLKDADYASCLKTRKRLKRLKGKADEEKKGLAAGEPTPDRDAHAEAEAKVAKKAVGGVLGLAAVVLAFPYSLPGQVPSAVAQLTCHVSRGGVVGDMAKFTVTDFKRSHHDSWQQQKRLFTADELDDLEGSVSSASYFS
jgi:hypothetical protein